MSLLEVPGKILEKIINKRLRTHLEIHNLLPAAKHGFRANRGTETVLPITIEKIAHNLGNKNQCCLVVRDVSKAFDKVWHKGLKFKINNAGYRSYYQRFSYPSKTIELLAFPFKTTQDQHFKYTAGCHKAAPYHQHSTPSTHTISPPWMPEHN